MRFLTLLTEKNKEKAKAFLDNLFLYYNQNQNVLPNQAKDLYYKLFRALDNAASAEANFIRYPGKFNRHIGEDFFPIMRCTRSW